MTVKRNDIMAAVMTRLQGILVASNYYSNLGSNVFEWRPKVVTEGGGGYVPTEQGELPALHVRDTLDETTQLNLRGSEEHALTLEVEIAHEAAATGATMRKQIEDVRKAIGTDTTWSGLALGTSQTITTESIRIQADRTFFRTLMRVQIKYTTAKLSES